MIGNVTAVNGYLVIPPQVIMTTKWDKLGFIILALSLWIIIYYVIGSRDQGGSDNE